MWCLEALPRLEAASRRNFHCLSLVSVSTPDVLALSSVSTNLPRSCYRLEAPIPGKLILLPQLTAFIKVTLKQVLSQSSVRPSFSACSSWLLGYVTVLTAIVLFVLCTAIVSRNLPNVRYACTITDLGPRCQRVAVPVDDTHLPTPKRWRVE